MMALPMQAALLVGSSALLSRRRTNAVTPSRHSGTHFQRTGVRAGPASVTIDNVVIRKPAPSIPGPAPAPARPVSGGTFERLDRGESSHIWSYADISKQIDVERPYYALYDVSAPSPLQTTRIGMPVSCKFRTESETGPEEHVPIGIGEVGRHLAVLGSIACAAANPVKQRHYYLAARGVFRLATGNTKGTPAVQPRHAAADELGLGSTFQAVGTCLKFQGGIAKVKLTVDRITITGELEPYGSGELTLMVCEETAFEKTLSGWTTHQAASSSQESLLALPPPPPLFSNPSDVSADTKLMNSPYSKPFSIVEAKDRAEDGAREGLLHFDDPRMAAGHFPRTPALPVAIVLANMAQCASFLYSAPFVVQSFELKCKRCAVLGEVVRFRASSLEHGVVKGSVMSAASGEELAAINMKLSF